MLHSLRSIGILIIGFLYFAFSFKLCAQSQLSSISGKEALALCDRYVRYDLDSLRLLTYNRVLVANETGDSFERAVAQRCTGIYLVKSGTISDGRKQLFSALNYFKSIENDCLISRLSAEIGNSYLMESEYDEAILMYRKSIKFGKQSSDPTDAFNAEYGLGRVYLLKGDTTKAVYLLKSYRSKAVAYQKWEAVSDVYSVLFNVYDAQGKRNLAHEMLRKSADAAKKSLSPLHLSNVQANLAILKFDEGDSDSSLYYFHRSREIREQMKNARMIVEAYYNLGSYFLFIENQDSAKKYMTYSFELASEYDFTDDALDAVSRMQEMDGEGERWSRLREKLTLDKLQKEGLEEELLHLDGRNTAQVKSDNQRLDFLLILVVCVALCCFGLLIKGSN